MYQTHFPFMYSRTLLLWVYNLSLYPSFISLYWIIPIYIQMCKNSSYLQLKKKKSFLPHFSLKQCLISVSGIFYSQVWCELFITFSFWHHPISLKLTPDKLWSPTFHSNFFCQVSSKNNFDSVPQGTPTDSIGTIQCSLAQRSVVFILWHLSSG